MNPVERFDDRAAAYRVRRPTHRPNVIAYDAEAFFRLVAGTGTLKPALQTIVVRVRLP